MNHAGRRQATGTPAFASIFSNRVERFRRLNSRTWAPMVERKTILSGLALVIASAVAFAERAISGKPRSESYFGGFMRKTPVAPANACARDCASAASGA